MYTEKEVAGGLQWMCFMLSWILFAFYAFQYRRQTCGWEGQSPPAQCPISRHPERDVLERFRLCTN